jgi:hypothetical protein
MATRYSAAAVAMGHNALTRATEVVHRRELRPVLTTGAEIMDTIFKPQTSN